MSKTEIIETKCLVIGAGPAGYTACIYAGRADVFPVLVTGDIPGGQLMYTHTVENFPGFAAPISGPDLMQAMQDQSTLYGTKMLFRSVTGIDFDVYPYRAHLSNGSIIYAHSIIIATGAMAKKLGLDSEARLENKGVSYCAVCDGSLYKGADVFVIGGGNAAVEEALYLARICKSVTLVHRRDKLRAESILQDRFFKAGIEVIWDTRLIEILGSDAVEGVILENVKMSEQHTRTAGAVFISIGHHPNTGAFDIPKDEQGYIKTIEGSSTKTSLRGVFTAGDVQDKHYRQAVTAAGLGCMAALDAINFLMLST